MNLGKILKITEAKRRQDFQVAALLDLAPSIIGDGGGSEPAAPDYTRQPGDTPKFWRFSGTTPAPWAKK